MPKRLYSWTVGTQLSILKTLAKPHTRNTIKEQFPNFLHNRNGKKLDTFSGDKSETGLKEYITR